MLTPSGVPVLICIVETHWNTTGRPLEDHLNHSGNALATNNSFSSGIPVYAGVYVSGTLDCHWIATELPLAQGKGYLGTRMRKSVLHSRVASHSICDPSRLTTIWQVDAASVPWTHYVSNNSIYYSPICFADKSSIAIDLITTKDRFSAALATSNSPPFFLLWSGVCAMTSAFHVLQKICHIQIFITLHF